jgi:diguanylate cyclase (GGDEF)-like protein
MILLQSFRKRAWADGVERAKLAIFQGYTMSTIVEDLAQTELLCGASEAILQKVLFHADPVDLLPGDILLSPQRENHHVYLLLSGVLSVHFDALNSPEIRELTKGVSVGEMSIIDGTPPSAFIIAKEASRVFPIHRDLLHELVADTNPIAGNLLRLLTQWMKANTQRIVKDRAQIGELTDHANIDALTGLYNRRWLDNALPRLLSQADKGELQLCILLIDVDHFKKYNDTQGHLGGDQALIAMGEVLKTTVRPYDFATRYGGEEFLVILPNTGKAEGIAVAERIRLMAEKRVITSSQGNSLPGVTISIGLAMSEFHSATQSLIAVADAQLYRAKAEGRNCVKY